MKKANAFEKPRMEKRLDKRNRDAKKKASRIPGQIIRKMVAYSRQIKSLPKSSGAKAMGFKDIPWFPVHWSQGTQVYTMELHTEQDLAMANGVVNTLITIEGATFPEITDMSTFFSEWRMKWVDIEFYPKCIAITDSAAPGAFAGMRCCSVVDYESAPTPTTYAGAVLYDTFKDHNCWCYAPGSKTARVQLDWLPDIQWRPCTTVTDDLAFVRFVGAQSSVGATEDGLVAHLRLTGLVEFRSHVET